MTAKLSPFLLNAVLELLESEERETVQGDLFECGASAWRSVAEVLGLVIRRQVAVWNHWRPWLAAFGLAIPSSFLLMGFSISISHAYQEALLRTIGIAVSPALFVLLSNAILLIGWAWTGGFVVGSLSRRTVWASGTLAMAPCMFCLERFHIESLSRLCLLLFLPPAIWGLHRGLRMARVKLSSALILALAITALTVPTWGSKGNWIPNWALSWPAWYLVVTARREKESRWPIKD
jgi:hypothetical protein